MVHGAQTSYLTQHKITIGGKHRNFPTLYWYFDILEVFTSVGSSRLQVCSKFVTVFSAITGTAEQSESGGGAKI